MNPLCYELLSGTLPPVTNPVLVSGVITNSLPIPIWVTPPPNPNEGPGAIPVSGQGGGDEVPNGNWVITVPGTGGLITVLTVPPITPFHVEVSNASLSAPNDIGPIPVPTYAMGPYGGIFPTQTRLANSTIVVPPDSPRVLVGCGVTPNGNLITREQYWERQGDSVCLAGNEKRTVSFTTFQGKQETSSESHEVAASLDSNISGGWGPVSASISASLSVNSTSFQQVTVTEQTTSYISHEIHNPHMQPIMYLRWQLTDVITIFRPGLNSAGQIQSMLPISSVLMAESPIVVTGPYWITAPPPVGSESAEAIDAPSAGLFTYK